MEERMFITRRALVLSTLAAPALAQGMRPLARVLVGFPAGGSADIVARLVAERLRGSYAANVIVENRPGASGRLAVEALKAAEPDGATMLLSASSMLSLLPHIYPASTRYDSFADVIPVCSAGGFPLGMAAGPRAGNPTTLRQFIEWGKGQAEIGYSSPSAGTTPHFLGIQFARAAGLNMTHVSYRGSSPAMQDLMGGTLGASFHPMVDLVGAADAGRVTLLAVTEPARMARYPDVGTFAEQGFPQFSSREWFGVFLPARTPDGVVQELNQQVQRMSATADYQAALTRLVMTPLPTGTREFAAMLKADWDRWAVVVRDSGFKPED
jgi:tripartite-type tricarboxylate transporter receptor subunit TctC